MSTRDDVHRLVDELDETALPDAARHLATLTQRDRTTTPDTTARTAAAVADLRRTLPWIGSLRSGHADLAERSGQILHDELGTHPR